MALPTYKDIVELIKRGATVEAQEQIMMLREGALELQEQNVALKEKVGELEVALQIKGQLEFDHGCYWLKEENRTDGPYCQPCYDTKRTLVRMQDWGNAWTCYTCKIVVERK